MFCTFGHARSIKMGKSISISTRFSPSQREPTSHLEDKIGGSNWQDACIACASAACRIGGTKVARRIILTVTLLLAFSCVNAWADVAIGYVSWDVIFPGNAGEFDIVNL